MITSSWYFWFATFTGVAALAVVLAPVAGICVFALSAHRRDAGAAPSWAWRSALADVGIVWGTVPFVWMTMLPGSGAGEVPGRVNLVPLADLATMGWAQIVGNLAMFAALGFFAPMRVAALASVRRVLLLGAGASVLIELAQYVLALDRVSSVDDVALNAAGAGLAALASRRWWRAPGADPVASAPTVPIRTG